MPASIELDSLTSPLAWENLWQKAKEKSFLRVSQKKSSGNWRDFYDGVSDTWLKMWGDPLALGRKCAECLISAGLLKKGQRVLDVGTGPGSLAIPLAEKGAKVTALDNSKGMIAQVESRAFNLGLSLETCCMPWEDYQPEQTFDLVVAGFFPQAMGPHGIERLEAFSKKGLALVLGTGKENVNWRRLLWDKIMDSPLPEIRFNLSCALNYLLASNRMPNLRHIGYESELNLSRQEVVEYFQQYFAIFGKNDPVTRDVIEQWAQEKACDQRIQQKAEIEVAMLYWQKPFCYNKTSE